MVFTKNVHVEYYVNRLSGVEKSRVFTTSTKKRKVGITLQKKNLSISNTETTICIASGGVSCYIIKIYISRFYIYLKGLLGVLTHNK